MRGQRLLKPPPPPPPSPPLLRRVFRWLVVSLVASDRINNSAANAMDENEEKTNMELCTTCFGTIWSLF
jgi:hypothetical protein